MTSQVMDRLKLIHHHNAHKRLVTAHSGLNWSGKCLNCNLTMVSVQRHSDNHTDGNWYTAIRETIADNPTIPTANVEFMYMAGAQRLCNGSAGHDCAAASSNGTCVCVCVCVCVPEYPGVCVYVCVCVYHKYNLEAAVCFESSISVSISGVWTPPPSSSLPPFFYYI